MRTHNWKFSAGDFVVHLKSGTHYEVLRRARMEHDQSPVYVYFNPDKIEVWVRPATEFEEKFDFAKYIKMYPL